MVMELDEVLNQCREKYYKEKQLYICGKKLNPIACSIETDDEEVILIWEKAKLLDKDALYQMAFFFHKGDRVAINKEKAFYCMNAAFFEGNDMAAGPLSECYYIGDGVEKDQTVAASLRKYGTENGNAICAYVLAYQYDNGIGVGSDLNKAFYYYLKAAERGMPEAQREIAKRYENGIGCEQNLERAKNWREWSEKRRCYCGV